MNGGIAAYALDHPATRISVVEHRIAGCCAVTPCISIDAALPAGTDRHRCAGGAVALRYATRSPYAVANVKSSGSTTTVCDVP